MNNAAAPPAEPASGTSFERLRFVLPALVAFAVFLALILWNGSPVSHVAAPVFVLGCRYYELARDRVVHRSGLLLLLILWKGCVVVWPIERFEVLGQSPLLAIGAVLALLALAVHLCIVQRRLRDALLAGGAQSPDEGGANWSCGGFLAWFPPLFAWSLADLFRAWPEPLPVLTGVVAAVLIVLQLRRSRWFRSMLMLWLLLGLPVDAAEWDAATIAWVLLSYSLYVGYFATAPRVQRTFFGRTW